jgi:hypothetical protein
LPPSRCATTCAASLVAGRLRRQRQADVVECGLAFNIAFAEDLLESEGSLFNLGKRPRPGRVRIKLPAIMRAPDFERKVLIENIESGGAQIAGALAFPLEVGAGLMIEVGGLMPIGGYVRWSRQSRCGIMFSKLLPVATAEKLAERCAIHRSWVSEVQAAHEALRAQDVE